MMKSVPFSLALLCCAAVAARAQGASPAGAGDGRLARVLARAGERVESYQKGLFSIAFTEVLRREELREDMTAKKAKEFVFETVVVREALPAAGEGDDYYPKSARRLKSVDGRPPKRGEQATTQFNVASLDFLLPKNLKPSEFSLEGEEALGGRAAFRVRWQKPGDEAKVEWKGTNFRVVSAPIVYLFWIDAETFDVLRLEARLAAPFEFESPGAFKSPFGRFGPSRRLRYAVQDYSVRFRRQRFEGPEQTLLVPESAEALTVIEGASRPRLRTTVRFSDYRRFRSDVKVVEEPDGEAGRQ